MMRLPSKLSHHLCVHTICDWCNLYFYYVRLKILLCKDIVFDKRYLYIWSANITPKMYEYYISEYYQLPWSKHMFLTTIFSSFFLITRWKALLKCCCLSFFWLTICKGSELKCELQKNKSGKDYYLSKEALAGIVYTSDQTSTNFWALDCSCIKQVKHIYFAWAFRHYRWYELHRVGKIA